MPHGVPDDLAAQRPGAPRSRPPGHGFYEEGGTFQYCFFVDGVLGYTAYLQADPHYLAGADAQPVLYQPLITPETTRTKGLSLWALLLANRGKKALPTGSHLLRWVIRPYLQSPQLQVGPVLAAGQVALNVTRYARRAAPPD